MAQNLFPIWDAARPTESVKLAYEWAIKNAQDQIDWYVKRSKPKRTGSQLIRVFSILFAAIGALCPLLDSAGVFGGFDFFGNVQNVQSKIVLGQWGYVFLALAAAIIGYDRYFGLSTGWMRYIVTQLSLQRILKEFQYDWAAMTAQQEAEPTKGTTQTFLQRAKDFTIQVENLVKQETDAWVVEFQNNIAQLEKVLKTEIDARKSGGMRIVVTNGRDFEKVIIRLNDVQVKEIVGVTECILDAVPPGRYEIGAAGKKEGKDFKVTKVVEVQPDSLASVELTLPSS